jgi:hypothetical protein
MKDEVKIAKYTGGTAYPRTDYGEGMSVLDHYAGQALVGIIAGQLPNGPRDAKACEAVAEEAFNLALAMTAQRRATMAQIEAMEAVPMKEFASGRRK